MGNKYGITAFLALSLITIRVLSQPVFDRDSVTAVLKKTPAFTILEDNYFITGCPTNKKATKENSDAKFQISFKHRLTSSIFPFGSYLFLTYTQKSFWGIYKSSKPFEESNYNPGIGLAKPIFKNSKLVSAIAFKFDHQSNGKDGEESRSWNFFSINFQTGLSSNTRFKFQAWYPFSYEENADLFKYIGYGEARFTWLIKQNKLVVDISGKLGTSLKGTVETAVHYRPFKFSNQYISVQWFNGYAESLIDYKSYSSMVRIGITIKPANLMFY